MTPPEPYGTFHLVFWLTGLALVFFAAFFLRKTGEKANNRLLFGTGLFLLLAEIYKQLFYTFVIGGGKYQFDRIPFQLCSMPMYLSLLLPFLKNGKFRQALYTFTASFGFMGGFVSYFSPESMCLPYWTLTIHSFSWHLILVFLGLYLFFSGRAGTHLRQFLPPQAYIFPSAPSLSVSISSVTVARATTSICSTSVPNPARSSSAATSSHVSAGL